MITIAQTVFDLLSSDEVGLEAMRVGVLNYSAYAKSIQPVIEQTLYKKVRIGSIVTALSRLTQRASAISSLKTKLHIEDLSIKSPLCEIAYDKTEDVSQKASRLVAKYSGKGFITCTQGIGEITFIVTQMLQHAITEQISVKPRGVYNNLSAITVRFNEHEYIEIPNMIYTLVAALAGKRINLIEIVSTFTEISFIVRHKDMKETVEVLKNNFLV